MPPRRRNSMVVSKARDVLKEILLTPSADRTEDDIRALLIATAENKFFKDACTPKVHRECCKVLCLQTLSKEDLLFAQGDPGDAFYIVHSGTVNVIVGGNQVAQIGPGASFGELALLNNEPRAAGIVASSECELMKIVQMDYSRILASDAVTQMARKYDFLASLTLFRHYKDKALRRETSLITLRKVSEGKRFVVEGSTPDAVFFVAEGEVLIEYSSAVISAQADLDQSEGLPLTFGKGDAIGQDDVLHDRQYSMSCVAATAVELYVCPQEEFLRFSDWEEDLRDGLKASLVVSKMLEANDPDHNRLVGLLGFLNDGASSAVIVALARCGELDFSGNSPKNQALFLHLGGVESLLKLLKCSEPQIRISSMTLLMHLASDPRIRKAISASNGIVTLTSLLRNPTVPMEVVVQACQCLSIVCQSLRNRLILRNAGGLGVLVEMLGRNKAGDVPPPAVIRCCCAALAQCCRNDRNRLIVRHHGIIQHLNAILKEGKKDFDRRQASGAADTKTDEDTLLPVVLVIQELVLDPGALADLHSIGAIARLLQCIRSTNEEILMSAIDATCRAAQNAEMRAVISQGTGMKDLIGVLNRSGNNEILQMAVASISACSKSPDNAEMVNTAGGIEIMCSLLGDDKSTALQINVAGALWNACLVSQRSRDNFRTCGGLQTAVALLQGQGHGTLTENVTGLLWAAAIDQDCCKALGTGEGMRLILSLLRSKQSRVQANACGALSSLMEEASNVLIFRTKLLSGVPIVLDMLSAKSREVQANACAAIGVMCKHDELLGIMTEQGLVAKLSLLIKTAQSDPAKKQIAFCIAQTAGWGDNACEFGKLGAVAPLVQYLTSLDKEVGSYAVFAMLRLSSDQDNCERLRLAGAVPFLTNILGSEDSLLAHAAAGSLCHIRFAYASRMVDFQLQELQPGRIRTAEQRMREPSRPASAASPLRPLGELGSSLYVRRLIETGLIY